MQRLKRKLPNWIEAFMLYTENTEPPTLFRKWTAISTIASALQRKVRVEWGTDLIFYPNLYIILVGPSATGKGTAMTPALNIMDEIPAVKLSAQATSLQALIRRLKENNLTDIDMETAEQIFHTSMTIFSEEFTVFLGYHNQELMAALCNWYDCKNVWEYDTISRNKEKIIGVWVNLIGGTTPDLIRSSLPVESIGGGLTSRIIFIFEETKGKLVVLPTKTQRELELRSYLIEDLEKISLLSGSYRWTPGFVDIWTDFCHECENSPPFYDPKFDGYLGRRRSHVMKLSMVISASHGRHDYVLSGDDLEEAIILLKEAEVKMGLVFRGVGKSDMSEHLHKAMVFLENSRTSEVPFYQFARYFGNDMDKFTMERVLFTLEAMKRISYQRKPMADDMIKILDMEIGDRSKIEQSNPPELLESPHKS